MIKKPSRQLPKSERVLEIAKFLRDHPNEKFRTADIARRFVMSKEAAMRCMCLLRESGLFPLVKDGWYWVWVK